MIPLEQTVREAGTAGDPHWAAYLAGRLERPAEGSLEHLFYPAHPRGRGICRLDPAEGRFLHDRVRALAKPDVLEIGRFTGGSTLLLAQAVRPFGSVVSLDLDPRCDAVLGATLERWGWKDSVALVVGDSRRRELPGMRFNVLFIDGDHSYEGVRADFEHWAAQLDVGGHVFFHDDADRPGICGVWRFCRELEGRPGWRLIARELSVSLYQKEAP
ncbi:MAG: class I SAM-dependent methyltransferase [Armatimonadia bacterium]